jgi:hypothetical protein
MPFDEVRPFGYASAPDVLRHITFVATFTAISRPNATQVHNQILAVSDELDGALLQANYLTPIATGATIAADLLRQWTSIGAAMYVVNSLPQGEDSAHLKFLTERFTAILKGIREGDLRLPADADKDTELALPRFNPASADNPTPYFYRGDEWDR